MKATAATSRSASATLAAIGGRRRRRRAICSKGERSGGGSVATASASEPLPQAGQPSVHPGLHRPRRYAEQARHLGLGEVKVEAEHKRGALPDRELLEGLPKELVIAAESGS
jgi:hypothetical protein